MSTVPNHALRRLRAGKLAVGLGLHQARTVAIAQIAKTAGFDWLFIDGEHSSIDLDTAHSGAVGLGRPQQHTAVSAPEVQQPLAGAEPGEAQRVIDPLVAGPGPERPPRDVRVGSGR